MSSTTIVAGVPAGIFLDFAGDTSPVGYLLCDGSEVSRSTYARLFDVIGTTYGVGDGSTTFKIPDYRSRVSVGAGAGSGLTNRVLGASVGVEVHILTEAELPSHTHIQNSHVHGILSTRLDSGGSSEGLQRYLYAAPSVWHNTEDQTAVNNLTGGGSAHNNVQPFITFNKIVRY